MPHDIINTLQRSLAVNADAAKAKKMASYMKTDQPFYGVYANTRDKLARDAIRLHPITTRDTYEQVVLTLWRGRCREEMYLAVLIAELAEQFNTLDAWPLFTQLTHELSWWDTLDWIAIGLVGNLLLEHRELEPAVEAFRNHPNMWTRRASLIAHNKHQQTTNRDLLADTILHLADEKEFFIRKAIGWVLREFSKTDPLWVSGFVATHSAKLSTLSQREALKAIMRTQQYSSIT